MVDDERRRSAEALLRQVRVQNFDASPSSIEPFGESVLSWRISAPEVRPPIRLTLRGAVVGRTGSTRVSPVMTSSYSLVAYSQPVSKLLAARVIEVDTSQCITGSVAEADVRGDLSPKLDEIIAEHEEVSRRRDDRVEIEYAGLNISLRLKAAIENVGDPNIDVDMLVSFRAEQGGLRYRLVSYSLDVDFPWWQDLINYQLLPAWLAAILAEGNQESIIRGQVTSALDDFIAEKQAMADAAGMRFLSVVARPDAIDLVLCPADDEARRLPPRRARPAGHVRGA
jgi:hypothetical protein